MVTDRISLLRQKRRIVHRLGDEYDPMVVIDTLACCNRVKSVILFCN